MSRAKVFKYCFFAFLYLFLASEIIITSGLMDLRTLIWPNTPGYFTGMWLSTRFFACYRYQYDVQGKVMQGSQLLPLVYKDTLKPKQIVRVYYDRDNPEKSFFSPGFNAVVAFCVLFVILLGVLLLFIPYLSWESLKKKKES